MTNSVTHAPKYPTYIITQEAGMVPRRKGPFFGNKMVEDFLRDAYRYDPAITCIVVDMETEDNTWYPESGYEWLDINGDGRKRHPRKDRPKQATTPPSIKRIAWIHTDTRAYFTGLTGHYHIQYDGHEWSLEYRKVDATASIIIDRYPNRSVAMNKAQEIHEAALAPYLDAPAPQTNSQSSEAEKINVLEERIASLEDELYEARQVPWPDWAKEILKSLQAHGYDPVVDGEVDLGEAFKDYLDGIAQAEEHDKLWMKDVFSVRDGGNSITLNFAEIKTARAFRNKFAANIVAAAPENHVLCRWLPIAQADRTINHVTEFTEIGLTLKNSDTFWVRDEDGRTYQAAWSEGNKGRDYWWDWEAERPVDPVEFMPHPLDPRWVATTETN